MRRIFPLLITCVAGLVPVAALAQPQTVQVQAGEHADYTRLILHIPAQSDWSLVRDSVSARLELAGDGMEFDLTQTFSRIPRTRLRDIRASVAGLDLYLACDCDVQAREDIPQFLIIDIIGTRNDAVYAPQTAPRPPERPSRLTQTPALDTPDPRRAGEMLARALRGDTTTPISAQPPIGPPDAPALSRLLAARETSGVDKPPKPNITHEISQVLASSVSSGMLQPATDFSPSSSPASPPVSNDPVADAHLAVVTGARTKPAAQDQTAPECPDDSFFDPSAWNIPTDRVEPLFQLRDLFNALDQIDERQVLELAREFLYFGFGAEARLALSLLAEPPEHTHILTAISYLVDISALPPMTDLEILRGCNPMGSLWTFLSQPDHARSADFSGDQLVQALQKLPPFLRLHLGPIVIQRLAAAGFSEQARVIHAALDRIAMHDTSALTLARVTLDLPNAAQQEAQILERTLTPETSDDDLIFLLNRRVTREEPVEDNVYEAATTRLFALRGSATGREIARLLIKAKTQAGDFQAAVDILNGRDAALDLETSQTLLVYILENAVSDADDVGFVTLVFAQRPWTLAYLPEPLAQQMSARLRRLGFYLQAELLDKAQRQSASDMQTSEQPIQDALVEQLAAAAPTPALALSEGDSRAPTEETMPEDDISHARAAQSLRRTQEEGASTLSAALPALGSAPNGTQDLPARPAEQMDQETDTSEGLTARGPDNQIAPPQAQEETGLLSQGRDALAQSADLRARIETLLEPAATQ